MQKIRDFLMSIICPNCGKEYDITLFEYGNTVKCDCGKVVELKHERVKDKFDSFKKLLSSIENEKQEKKLQELKSEVDRICTMILSKRYKKEDVDIEINKFKKRFLKVFPDKKDLFNMIYKSRFKRLWEQFRE